jgi:hypothetical protein
MLVVAGACTFTLGASDLQNGDCGAGQKACPDKQTGVMRCVGFDQPEYGCSRMSCGVCPLQNATSRCDPNNNCAVAVCNTGYAHCGPDPSTGCETSIYTDIANCGLDQASACGKTCGFVTAMNFVNQAACINGVCQIGGCTSGHQDCDKMLGNGCECAAPGTCNPTTGACIGLDGGAD